jgi:hypothetical protein
MPDIDILLPKVSLPSFHRLVASRFWRLHRPHPALGAVEWKDRYFAAASGDHEEELWL